MPDRVFIVEDHPLVRRGYASVLNAEMELDVCGMASGAAEGLEKIEASDPDIVLVDLSLEEGSGLELIKDLQARRPDLPLLVVSLHDAALYARRCLRAGALGYIMKDQASDKLVEAVRQVLRGRLYLSEEMKNRFLRTMGDGGIPKSPLERLSDREIEVFELLGRGLETAEIAEHLTLSPKTVYSYYSRIKEKLDVESNPELRQQAVIWVECSGSKSSVEET